MKTVLIAFFVQAFLPVMSSQMSTAQRAPVPQVSGPVPSSHSGVRATDVHCGVLVDGKSSEPRKDVYITIEGEKIISVGELQAYTKDSPAPIDLTHDTCLPGLIDTHTHVLLNGDITAEDYDVQLLKQSIPYRAILSARNARIALDHGFTTMRDLETEGAMYADVDIKNAIANGEVPGPRMQV